LVPEPRVSEQHDVVVTPARVLHQREIQPADEIVGEQRMTAQIVGKHALKTRTGVRLAP
jgi:hypothetical protein